MLASAMALDSEFDGIKLVLLVLPNIVICSKYKLKFAISINRPNLLGSVWYCRKYNKQHEKEHSSVPYDQGVEAAWGSTS